MKKSETKMKNANNKKRNIQFNFSVNLLKWDQP